MTTYDPITLIATLTARLARAEGRVVELEAEIAALTECYNDRESDLSYEYDARMAAEAQAEAWRAVAAFADHDRPHCNGRDACVCGYSRAYSAAVQADHAAAAPSTPLARIVALGRAALAYEAHRGTPAGAALRGPFLAALRAAEKSAS